MILASAALETCRYLHISHLITHRSLKLRADFKNRQAIGDRQQKRSPKGSKSAAAEEKGA